MSVYVEKMSHEHDWVKVDSELENSWACWDCHAFCAREEDGRIWYYEDVYSDVPEWETLIPNGYKVVQPPVGYKDVRTS